MHVVRRVERTGRAGERVGVARPDDTVDARRIIGADRPAESVDRRAESLLEGASALDDLALQHVVGQCISEPHVCPAMTAEAVAASRGARSLIA